MSEIPNCWVIAPLGELLVAIVGGGTPSKSNAEHFRGSIPFMTVKDMHERFIADTQDHITEQALESSASTLIPADTLVVASRMSLGKIARPQTPVAINQDLKALFLHGGFDKTYIEYAWRAKELQIQAMGTGTTVKGIRLEDIRGLEIPVAPSAEQTRIADKLDTLLARVQACNDRIDTIPASLKRFRQAVLSAAISGELSPDLSVSHETKSSNGGFPIVMLGELLAEPLRNGKSVRDGSGLPVLRLTSLKAGGIDLSETKRGDWSGVPDVNRFLIQNGDYLVSRGNGSMDLVGRGALVSDCEEDIAFPDTMIRIRLDAERVHPGYLKYVWSSQLVRRQIERLAKTTAGIWKLSQPDLESVRFPLPTLDDQWEIVRRVEALFKLADRIESRYIAASGQAQRLTPLLLAKAFRGELVPQDPKDESASVLLERIAAERAKTAVQPHPRKPTAGRKPARPRKEHAAMTKSRQDDDVKGQPYLAKHLRLLGGSAPAEALFKASELPVADFYKQLAWEVAEGHVMDSQDLLEPRDAA